MMKDKFYYANEKQVRGVEEYRLMGGKGDQMQMFHLRNGLGLEAQICPDRCIDITRLTFKGVNCSYFGAVGQVAPSYYQDFGKDGFVKSFTGGFFTTCGFANVGDPCEVDGVILPHHGSLGNTPADHAYYTETDDAFLVCGTVRQALQGGERLQLKRVLTFSKTENKIIVEDTVKNIGDQKAGVMLLYHVNLAYPMLSEDATIEMNADKTTCMNDGAINHPDDWNKVDAPSENGYGAVYAHEFEGAGFAKIYNAKLDMGLKVSFDAESLPCLNEWKVSKKYDYVLGLEPGNCFPVGRPQSEAEGHIDYLEEDQEKTYRFEVTLFEGKE